MLLVPDLEIEWLAFLQVFPTWIPEDIPLVVISPHPDDEVLGAGGLIAAHVQKRLPVTVLAVTDGEAAYPDFPDLAATRQNEQQEALSKLGLESEHIVRLGLHDSDVASAEDLLKTKIEGFLKRESYVVAPWSKDPHPDHEACGRAAKRAAAATGATLVSYFFWTWHRLQPSALKELKLFHFELRGEMPAKKAAALSEYRSQLKRKHGEPILPPRFLTPALRPFECVALHD